jgi:hypothetical protein
VIDAGRGVLLPGGIVGAHCLLFYVRFQVAPPRTTYCIAS